MAILLWIEQTLKESKALNASLCLLKSHLSCLASYIYFMTQLSKGKKNWKCDSEKLFE